jgi:hypothetical protein
MWHDIRTKFHEYENSMWSPYRFDSVNVINNNNNNNIGDVVPALN